MKRFSFALAFVGAVAGGVEDLRAQSRDPFVGNAEPIAAAVSGVPQAAFFIGLGGGYQAVDFHHQNAYAQGVSQITQKGSPAAVGTAFGSTDLDFDTSSRFVPPVQLGYFRHWAEGDWLWGVKCAYNYAGATSVKRNAPIPQAGGFTGVETSPFSGNVLANSYLVALDHQLAFTPFLGRSFANSYVYLGGGPCWAQTRTKLGNAVGFADINGIRTSITGAPSTFPSADWVWGGSVVAGLSYFLSPSWFLDCHYDFSIVQNPASAYAAPFANTNPRFTSSGVLSGNTSGGVMTHSFFISLNRAF